MSIPFCVADRTHSHDIDLAVKAAAQQVLGADPVIGARFGPWRVSREIGRGGMGIVYLVIRDDAQFQKQAALKLIRAGMDTAELLLRFRHERQILASLDHPYIARLIDGGTTPEGRPFLVMDYVEGLRIDTWCRDRGLAVEDRCRLFLKVCEAVSYAHRSLVVHRDLKPGNILIAADGSPKLLDFGVAKLLAAGSRPGLDRYGARRSLPTTPARNRFWASPSLRPPISTPWAPFSTSLLSGTKPHRLDSATPAEIQRAVCQTEIPRPSAAVDRPASQRHASAAASGRRPRQHRDDGPAQGTRAALFLRGSVCRRYSPPPGWPCRAGAAKLGWLTARGSSFGGGASKSRALPSWWPAWWRVW